MQQLKYHSAEDSAWAMLAARQDNAPVDNTRVEAAEGRFIGTWKLNSGLHHFQARAVTFFAKFGVLLV